ncbi:MAG: hypothetical protein WCX28_08945 [Bacteriovoracaceae bacterium]|nr:hypothetical protein [Bacteroidota bacterium]
MKTILTIVFLSFSILVAQEDECDVSSSLGNSWLESKRSYYGVNCMLAAINKLHNETYQVAEVNGVGVPNIALFTRMNCSGFLGCWQSTTSAMNQTIKYEGSGEVAVYSRPVFIQTTGKLITLTMYSSQIDTSWVQFEDEKIKKELIDEYDKYENEIAVSLTRHVDSGVLY